MPSAEILIGDSAKLLATRPAASVDLTVTSPPYDDLRTYKGFTFDFETIARELYRVTKDGGVVVWVVGDATVNGSETGTSFRQALFFKDVCGFNLHDTMIYEKAGTGACGSNYAYWQAHEYMFVLTKGRPTTVNRIADHVNVRAGAVVNRGRLSVEGEIKDNKRRVVPAVSVRTNIWRIHGGKSAGYKASNARHPAPFPEALAHDHIVSWSNPGDTVLDPFLGSGTTGKVAVRLGRKFVGIEVSEDYAAMARARIDAPSVVTRKRSKPANDNRQKDLFAA
jgi:DNA modification methylase